MQNCIDKAIEWLVNYKQKVEGMNQWKINDILII